MKVTWPLAAIVISIVVAASGVWLALVLTHTLPVATGLALVSHLGAFLTGGALPLVIRVRRDGEVLVRLSADDTGAHQTGGSNGPISE